MTTINIKKSNVALLLQTNNTNEQIAETYGITVNEVKSMKETFGFTKSRKPKTTPEYTINLIDDTAEVLAKLNTKQTELSLEA